MLGDVSARDHQGVPLRDREAVTEGEGVFVLQGDSIRRYGAEGTGVQTKRVALGRQKWRVVETCTRQLKVIWFVEKILWPTMG